MENKKQKFERLANKRVNSALKQLDLIGNLSNKNAYDYSGDEINQIIEVLNKKIRELKTRFSQGLSSKNFKL
jgi:hypothetical protein